MFNKYRAGSDLAFSVMVGNERMRIVFEGKTMGSSIYMTRDPKVQNAIESHYWFNDKFFLVESIDEKKETADAKKKAGIRNTDAVVIQEVACLYLKYPKAHARMRLAAVPASEGASETGETQGGA